MNQQSNRLDTNAPQANRVRAILDSVTQLHAEFSPQDNIGPVFERMLSLLLRLSNSEYGFIGETRLDQDGQPFLRTFALTNIAWDDATRAFYEENAPQGLEFKNLETLFGHTLRTGEPVLTNLPASHPSSGGIPDGHPDLNAYLGLPIYSGDKMVGMVGMANRPEGFDDEVIAELKPLLNTCGSFISQLIAQRERDEALHKLGESEKYQRAILANVVDPLFLIDENGGIESANKAAFEVFEYAKSDICGMAFHNIAPMLTVDALASQATDVSALNTDSTIATNRFVEARTKSGKRLDIEYGISRLNDDLGQKYILSARDITERLRLDRLKDEFIATVSHELRTPVTAVKGALDMLNGLKESDAAQSNKLIAIARRNAARLGLLLNDILDINKIESGAMPIAQDCLHLPTLLQNALNDIDTYAQGRNINFVLGRDLPDVHMFGDEHRLVQILNNLLSNAAKFSPEGGEVLLDLQENNGKAIIIVKDSGCGIAEEFQPRMFDKFTQADASDSKSESGTGLGLAIVQSLVERHTGQIRYETAKGKGTSFYLEFMPCPPCDLN